MEKHGSGELGIARVKLSPRMRLAEVIRRIEGIPFNGLFVWMGSAAFAFASGSAFDAGDSHVRESVLPEDFGRPNVAVVPDDVVRDGDDLFFLRFQANHHTQGVQDLGLGVRVLFAPVRFSRDDDGFFRQWHREDITDGPENAPWKA